MYFRYVIFALAFQTLVVGRNMALQYIVLLGMALWHPLLENMGTAFELSRILSSRS